jgi:hypothetical protein
VPPPPPQPPPPPLRRLWLCASAALVLAAATPADADTWSGGVESGVEYDSNVHRVEVDPAAAADAPVAVPLARAGGHLAGTGEADWGRWTLAGQSLVRKVLGDELGEDVGVVSGDVRWDRGLGERRVLVGARARYYDVIALDGGDGARAFGLGAADAQLTLVGEGGARVVAALGVRDFRYKPDDDFDWRGPTAGLRFGTTLWHDGPDGEDATATLELAAVYRVERRGFRGLAFANGCMPGEVVDPICFVPTGLARTDVHHVAEAEVVYTGEVVATGGYQLAVNDSSSYGQSLVRHRVTASVTGELPARVFATGIVALQLDQYLDPLLLARDVVNQTFTTIDDENRSMLSVRLSRRLGSGWAAEARWGFSADSLSTDDLQFRRHVVYAGLTWGSDD